MNEKQELMYDVVQSMINEIIPNFEKIEKMKNSGSTFTHSVQMKSLMDLLEKTSNDLTVVYETINNLHHMFPDSDLRFK